ncbi:ArsR/SmtB family transcription factor [Brevibacillus fluminis]|uniref:ArsR/SmtB family transcription factor n=1 Tax=Brevibacillus fluminis TaxID=511487 RepID=UPI003F8B7373
MQDLALWLQKHVTLSYLPVYEFFLSLHVAGNPTHHTTRLKWAEALTEQLPTTLAEELLAFHTLSHGFLHVLDFFEPWRESAYPSVEAGLERVESLTPVEFIEAMLGPAFHPKQLQSWMEGRTSDGWEQLAPEERDLIRRPLAAKRAFLEFCYAYLPYYAVEQRRIEPWIIQSVHESQERLQKEPLAFMDRIHPRLQLHDDFLQFHKAHTYQFRYTDLQQIVVHPSTFVSPHLLLGIYGERISVGLALHIPGSTEKPGIPADFILKMKVFSDLTRVTILKNLLLHSYCTQQLADMHGISEPAVVKHIKILLEAGYIWGERKGRYVFYRGIPDKIERLAVDIHEFIDLPDPELS